MVGCDVGRNTYYWVSYALCCNTELARLFVIYIHFHLSSLIFVGKVKSLPLEWGLVRGLQSGRLQPCLQKLDYFERELQWQYSLLRYG